MTLGKLGRAALLVTACASLLSMAPGVASAATCSGTGCDNRDPEVTGCASGATTVGSSSTAKGLFELRYSSACGTKWVRFSAYQGGSTRPGKDLQLTVWDRPRNKYVDFFASPAAGAHWGNMVYSPGATRCGWGQADWNGGATFDANAKASTC
ncbi:DUF2690 domain-containing protein [Lentzea albida]|uniref:DUF2690 domain-containing protein n=1 Tax=Lentzea albida TaxID=65499 RepID=A0A1H9W2N6_9PSEU|nr:DUF2690 domain-containing protein [Lentzea albida]SES28165.1 Protein of unknown function [Lentzea albida]